MLELIHVRCVIKLNIKGADISYWPTFISTDESKLLLQQLMQDVAWRQDQLMMFGKQVNIPRLQAWYGEPHCFYAYSNLSLSPLPWTPTLIELRNKISQHCQHPFNAVLANCYRDHQDSVGWHSDDEPELGLEPVIASLSLGATREFQLKNKSTGELTKLPLQSGSLLLMAGKTQQNYQHAIPKSRIGLPVRINLTFRYIAS